MRPATALDALATVAPERVRSIAQLKWFERYAHQTDESRLSRRKEAREEYARMAGEDGLALLEAIYAADPVLGYRWSA